MGLDKMGLEPCDADAKPFVSRDNKNDVKVMVLVYVDDMLTMGYEHGDADTT